MGVACSPNLTVDPLGCQHMAIFGQLSTMGLSDLLQFLENGLKSGVLRLSRESIRKEIFFENGTIVGSTSTDPKEYFGQFLLHYGKIDEAQLRLALEKQRDNRIPLGYILASMNVFDEEEMLNLLQQRALDIIYELFLWEQGDFEFQEHSSPPANLIPIAIKATHVMMEGTYRVDEWCRYRELIRSDGAIFELVPGHNPTRLPPGSNVPKILWFIKKGMSVGEICYNLHAPPFQVYSQLCQLINAGSIRVVDDEQELPPSEPDDYDSEDQAQMIEGMLQRAEALLTSDATAEAMRLLQAVLGTEPGNVKASELLTTAETRFIEQIYDDSKFAEAVPKLADALDELIASGLGSKESFILSRINGSWDVRSIVSICPFREAESLLVLKELCEQKLITF